MSTRTPAAGAFRWRVQGLALVAAAWLLGACAAGPQLVDHAFGFNAVADSPDIEILDYRYGDSKQPGAYNPEELRREGRSVQATGVHGAMTRGDSLYVKWRVRRTGQVCEDSVDLRGRLPADIADHRIYFMVRGAQLYVYLIPPESKKRPAGKPAEGPRLYGDLDVVTIYPDRAIARPIQQEQP
jgi:hypothetical protein